MTIAQNFDHRPFVKPRITGAAGLERLVRDALRLKPALVRDELELDTWENVLPSPVRFEISVWAPPLNLQAPGGETRVYDQQDVVLVEIAPGATAQIPALFRHAIQRVECQESSCLRGRCVENHEGVVNGGLAPMLIRKGQRARLHPSLLPTRDVQSSAGIAPQDLAARLREALGGAEDPAIAKARAARRAKGET